MLGLDSLMIRVAALRSGSLHLVRHINQSSSIEAYKLDGLAIEAQELDLALESWSLELPEEFKFSVCFLEKETELTKSSLQYEGAIHQYATYGHAAVWNRYRAVRLIVDGIRMRILLAQAKRSSERMTLDAELESCRKTIDSLAIDMCRSIPFFFNSNATQAEGQDSLGTEGIAKTEHEIIPNLATFLAWPLSIAVSVEAISYPHRQWLRRQLKTTARVLGNDIVQFIADKKVLSF